MSEGCHMQAVDCTALLDGMVLLGAVLCALEAGVMAAAVSFTWLRKWTVLLKWNVFGHFRWCELHLVSPIFEEKLGDRSEGLLPGGGSPPSGKDGSEAGELCRMGQETSHCVSFSACPHGDPRHRGC